jgi:hypothetical protein
MGKKSRIHGVMEDEKDIKNLDKIIKGMLAPLKGVSLSRVIEGISGFKIVPFNQKDTKHLEIIKKLTQVAKVTTKEINKTGIDKDRVNEVGNAVEPFVEKALNSVGYKANKPKTKSGKTKSTGYPDLEFEVDEETKPYLEIKTFNEKNIDTTQRSFYLSPSEDFKVTRATLHFLLSFRMEKENGVYKVKGFKIISIENLKVDVKYEFNADNVRLYSKDSILAEEDF